MAEPAELYVTYSIRPRDGRFSGDHCIPQSAIITLPSDQVARDIPEFVRNYIRPRRAADPSDNYSGQSPDEVVIINMINLKALL